MPNYKLCRFCTKRFIPVKDERICIECQKDIQQAVSMPTGEPVQTIDVSRLPPEPEPVPEPVPVEVIQPSVHVVQPEAPTPKPVVDTDKEAMEAALKELDKGESAEIKEEKTEEVIVEAGESNTGNI